MHNNRSLQLRFGTLTVTLQQTSHPDVLALTPSQQKRTERREKFRQIGEVLTANQIAWRDRLADHQFEPVPLPVQDPDLSSRMYGPRMKVLQYIRTVRKGK